MTLQPAAVFLATLAALLTLGQIGFLVTIAIPAYGLGRPRGS